MSGYLLTPAADNDLEEIWQFVCTNSGPERANDVEDQLHAGMHRLSESPGIGHVRTDLAAEALRFWAVHQFLIVYRSEARPIQIVRVLHGTRDVQAILGS